MSTNTLRICDAPDVLIYSTYAVVLLLVAAISTGVLAVCDTCARHTQYIPHRACACEAGARAVCILVVTTPVHTPNHPDIELYFTVSGGGTGWERGRDQFI